MHHRTVSINQIKSASKTRKLNVAIEKNRDKVAGAIIALDTTQIGPYGVDFNNTRMEMFKSAQILLHLCLLVYDIRDLCCTDTENSKTKKLIHLSFHSIFLGIACFQLAIHIELHLKKFTCNSNENHYLPLNGTELFVFSEVPQVNPLCTPIEILFWTRIGITVVAAAMKVVAMSKGQLSNFQGGLEGSVVNTQPSGLSYGERASSHYSEELQNYRGLAAPHPLPHPLPPPPPPSPLSTRSPSVERVHMATSPEIPEYHDPDGSLDNLSFRAQSPAVYPLAYSLDKDNKDDDVFSILDTDDEQKPEDKRSVEQPPKATFKHSVRFEPATSMSMPSSSSRKFRRVY